MQHPPVNPWRKPRLLRAAAVALALPAVIALAACGSSSGGSTGTNAAASAVNPQTGQQTQAQTQTQTQQGQPSQSPPNQQQPPNKQQRQQRRARFAKVRACLEKQGVTLPKPQAGGTPGQGGQRPFSGAGGEKFRAAMQKCGGFGGRPGGFGRPASAATLQKFAACMRENGVDLPAPNTSGTGPVFDTKGIDTASAAFGKARKKCQIDLKGAFGGPPPNQASGAPTG